MEKGKLMSDLKFDLNKNEFLMDKVSKKLFFVIKITLHDVWIRDESDAKNNDPDIKQMPKNLVNKIMTKVNPDTMKVLYGDREEDPNAIKPSFDPDSFGK